MYLPHKDFPPNFERKFKFLKMTEASQTLCEP